MCGIVAIAARQNVVDDIYNALKRLEYRGYDSAGLCVFSENDMVRRRAVGKLINLEKVLQQNPVRGTVGIGHTRWATTGKPSEINAHPHATDRVVLVHNGIIENYKELLEQLRAKGYRARTETDTEVIALLLTAHLDAGLPIKKALPATLQELRGAYALAIMEKASPDTIYFAREGSPLVIGKGSEASYLGSDAIALAPFTPHVIYPEEGDWGYITPGEVALFDARGNAVDRPLNTLNLSPQSTAKGLYRHYMEKEIFEQPAVLQDTLDHYLNSTQTAIDLGSLPFDPQKVQRLSIIACGTSYYAGCVAKYWIEQHLRLPVEVEIASEFRYRTPALGAPGTHMCLFISQSGETIDTLAALRYAKAKGLTCVGVVNVPHSAIAREAHMVLPTYAGPEIGVASTKAFTCQLMTLACFLLGFHGQQKDAAEDNQPLLAALKKVPGWLNEMQEIRRPCLAAARTLSQAQDVLYLGRGTSFPMALEGALKLKEISYIHAEAYAAGEMKHGPIALIDEATPVVALVPTDDIYMEKTLSNLHEAHARGGKIVAICDSVSQKPLKGQAIHTIVVPQTPPFVQPFILALPIQLLAYETAVLKGTDVDQPRNLAKSVTVE